MIKGNHAGKKNFKKVSELIWNLKRVLFIFALAFPPDFSGDLEGNRQNSIAYAKASANEGRSLKILKTRS